MSQSEAMLQSLPDEVRGTLRAYVTHTERVFGNALEAVLLYGSAARGEFLPGRSNLNLMIVLSGCGAQVLHSYASIHRRWQKEGIVVPLFFTPEELQQAATWFPLEYLEIRDAYVLLKGRDPFLVLQIDLQRLRAECEQEIRGNLLRLRQRFVEGGGKAESAALLMPLSLTALLPALRGIFRVLERKVPPSSELLLAQLQSIMNLDTGAFEEVLRLKRGAITPGPVELPRLFDRYHTALQALVLKIAQLSSPGSA